MTFLLLSSMPSLLGPSPGSYIVLNETVSDFVPTILHFLLMPLKAKSPLCMISHKWLNYVVCFLTALSKILLAFNHGDPPASWKLSVNLALALCFDPSAHSNAESVPVTSKSWRMQDSTPLKQWPTLPRRSCSTSRASVRPRLTRSW